MSDLEAAISFYRLLGFDFADGEADDHAEAALGHGLRLMLDTEESVKSFSDWTAPTGSHRVAMALLCDTPVEVDDLHAAVVSAGFRSQLDPFDAPWGQRYCTLLDPDGNAVDIFSNAT